MPRTSRFLAWAVVCGVVASTAGQVSAAGLELAVARAKKTGLPLLIIGSGAG